MAPSGSEGSSCGEGECPEREFYSGETALPKCSAANSKRARQSEDDEELCDRSIKLDDCISVTLHEYVLEKIIVRLPFKSLFRAALLSKSWKLRFSSESFQSEVQSLTAPSWKSYAPLYVNHKKDLVGYESSSERWHVLPNHSYLWYVARDVVEHWCLKAGAGSLLCWTKAASFDNGSPDLYRRTIEYNVQVTNPLTRTWRQLPRRSIMKQPHLLHVVCDGTEAYKVMLVTLRPKIVVQIFDSTDSSWTLDSHDTTFKSEWGGIVFVDGVLYMIFLSTLRMRVGYTLISFDVEHNLWTEMPLVCVFDADLLSRLEMVFHDVRFSEIIVCGSKVMLVVAHRDKLSMMEFDFDAASDDEQDIRDLETISVFQLELDCGVAVEASRVPNEMAGVANVCSASGHGDFIYIGGHLPSSPLIVYNVETEEWHWVNSATDRLKTTFPDTDMSEWLWTPITYQPGVNTFLKV